MSAPVDPRTRFDGAAHGYARHRPGYPEALVDWVVSEARVGRGAAVADVGCGTGIFTRALCARGLAVVGVDPSEDMLAQARAQGGGERYARGEAAATGLDDASADLVSVAQAFHWFDLDAALAEFARILRPGGHVAAVWNIRGEGAFMDAYADLLRRFSKEYEVTESWDATLEALRLHSRTRNARGRSFPNAQHFDFEGLHGRTWSASYVVRGVEDRVEFDAGLRALFDEHARDGVLEFPYRAEALVFGLGPVT